MKSTPPYTSVRMASVIIEAGLGLAICAPTVIPVVPLAPVPLYVVQRLLLETHGTIFHGKQAAVELIVRVLACLAEGLGIRATARSWLLPTRCCSGWSKRRAPAGLFRVFSDLHLEQLQLDELYAVRCETSKPVRLATTRPSSVWSAHHTVDGDGPAEQVARGGRCRHPCPGPRHSASCIR